MSAGKVTVANATSDNQFSFRFPYAGKNVASFVLSQSERKPLAVAFSIERGQIVCSDCTLQIRFDDDPEPQAFSTEEPADHDRRVVFLRAAQRFVDRARTAQRIRVEFAAFQNGTVVADFRFRRSLQWTSAPSLGGESRIREDMDIESGCHSRADFIDCLQSVRQCLEGARAAPEREACRPGKSNSPATAKP